jgi:hypothetical protein
MASPHGAVTKRGFDAGHLIRINAALWEIPRKARVAK